MAHDRISHLAAVVAVSLYLVASARAEDVQLLGAGAESTCETWLSDRQSLVSSKMENWALGYLSGAATWSPDLDTLHGLDSDAVLHWLDDYCRANPTGQFTEALRQFVNEHRK